MTVSLFDKGVLIRQGNFTSGDIPQDITEPLRSRCLLQSPSTIPSRYAHQRLTEPSFVRNYKSLGHLVIYDEILGL